MGEQLSERQGGGAPLPERASASEWTRAALSWACGILSLGVGAMAAARVFAWCGRFLLDSAPATGSPLVVGFTWLARTALAIAPPLLTFFVVAVAVASLGALLVPSAGQRRAERSPGWWSRQ
jgi:hypothetical protein